MRFGRLQIIIDNSQFGWAFIIHWTKIFHHKAKKLDDMRMQNETKVAPPSLDTIA